MDGGVRLEEVNALFTDVPSRWIHRRSDSVSRNGVANKAREARERQSYSILSVFCFFFHFSLLVSFLSFFNKTYFLITAIRISDVDDEASSIAVPFHDFFSIVNLIEGDEKFRETMSNKRLYWHKC